MLLSCSHCFHRKCLRSWETFARQKCCPVCRKRAYDKRATDIGAINWRTQCAIKLQSAWRAFQCRRRVMSIRRALNPGDAAARAHSLARLGIISDRLMNRVDDSHDEIDLLFAELDGELGGVALLRAALAPSLCDEADWTAAFARAIGRGLSDCPVCLAALGEMRDFEAGQAHTETPEFRVERLSLLSCSHVLHERCLNSFEKYCINATPTCPVCRGEYVKKPILGFIKEDEGSACRPCAPVEAVAAQRVGRAAVHRGAPAPRSVPGSVRGGRRVRVAGRGCIPGVAFS